VLICLCAGVGAQRQFVTEHQPSERVVGLLNLPEITGGYADDACGTTGLPDLDVVREPSETAPVIGSVRLGMHRDYGCALLFRRRGYTVDEELPTQESDYEIAAAVVYERRDEWLRIALPRGSGWVEREEDEDFLAYPQILAKRLSYLRENWDGQLRRSPNAKSAAVPVPTKPVGIEVLRVRRTNNEDWLRVRFVTERCGQSGTLSKPIEGWVPAYGSDGAPTAWFHSRGC
jgi:hypothetical protein